MDTSSASGVREALLRAGATPIGADAYEALRVAQAAPAYGQEMGQPYNPLETGLIGAIDFAKGCYIGQEVIARLDTYEKVQKHLVTLQFSEDARVSQGDSLAAEGRAVGLVTSVSPLTGDGLVGLGYVRKAHANPGCRLDLQAPAEGWAEVGSLSQLFGPGD